MTDTTRSDGSNGSAATLEERVARLETAEEVRNLAAAYGRACDHHDLDAIRKMFHPDAVLSVPGQSWSGADDVVGFYRGAWGDQPSPSRHFMAGVATSNLEADRAESTSYFSYVTTVDGQSNVGWGEYRDTFVRHDGRMVFGSKHIEMDLLVDVNDGWAKELRAAWEAK
jgi:ketosteroid isomerase-like protein